MRSKKYLHNYKISIYITLKEGIKIINVSSTNICYWYLLMFDKKSNTFALKLVFVSYLCTVTLFLWWNDYGVVIYISVHKYLGPKCEPIIEVPCISLAVFLFCTTFFSMQKKCKNGAETRRWHIKTREIKARNKSLLTYGSLLLEIKKLVFLWVCKAA